MPVTLFFTLPRYRGKVKHIAVPCLYTKSVYPSLLVQGDSEIRVDTLGDESIRVETSQECRINVYSVYFSFRVTDNRRKYSKLRE